MKYLKIITLLDNTPNQSCVKDRGRYNTNSQIKFKTLILKSSLCYYSNGYTFVKETIIVQTQQMRTQQQIMLIKK